MSYTPNNVSVYCASYAGTVAGIGASERHITAQLSTKYAGEANVAGAFAQEFDTQWGANPINAFQYATIQSACEAFWEGRAPQALDTEYVTPATFADNCKAIIALIQAGEGYIEGQGITPGPWPPGGGGGYVLHTQTFSAQGLASWVAPAGLLNGFVDVEFCGGGGGGGTGCTDTTGDGTGAGAGKYDAGGGGGGAAQIRRVPFYPVVPGNTYAVYVGNYGVGGVVVGTQGDDGFDGEDSAFDALLAWGGGGGSGAQHPANSSAGAVSALGTGGTPVRCQNGQSTQNTLAGIGKWTLTGTNLDSGLWDAMNAIAALISIYTPGAGGLGFANNSGTTIIQGGIGGGIPGDGTNYPATQGLDNTPAGGGVGGVNALATAPANGGTGGRPASNGGVGADATTPGCGGGGGGGAVNGFLPGDGGHGAIGFVTLRWYEAV